MHTQGDLTKLEARGHKEIATLESLEAWSDTMNITVQNNSGVMGGKKNPSGR